MEKSGRLVENCKLAWKMQMSITLLITDAFVNFLAVHDIQHLKSENLSPFDIENRRIHCIGNFSVYKTIFKCFCSHKDE